MKSKQGDLTENPLFSGLFRGRARTVKKNVLLPDQAQDSDSVKSFASSIGQVTNSIDNCQGVLKHSLTPTDANETKNDINSASRFQTRQSFIPTAISETDNNAISFQNTRNHSQLDDDLSKLWLRAEDDVDVWYINAKDSSITEWELPNGEKEVNESELAVIKTRLSTSS